MLSTTRKLVAKFLSHIPWLDASKQAMKFAVMVEEAMRVSLADFQEIAPPASINMYPYVERLLS